jgi:hypothetical protein
MSPFLAQGILLDVNVILRDVLTMVDADLPAQRVSVSAELREGRWKRWAALRRARIRRPGIDAAGRHGRRRRRELLAPRPIPESRGCSTAAAEWAASSIYCQTTVSAGSDVALARASPQQVQAGVVGYVYKEVGCDSGTGDRVGCFQSQVLGSGPQLGYIFPVGGMQGYLNFKSYEEFDASDRPKGWNAWVTFVLTPAAAAPPTTPKKRMITK